MLNAQVVQKRGGMRKPNEGCQQRPYVFEAKNVARLARAEGIWGILVKSGTPEDI